MHDEQFELGDKNEPTNDQLKNITVYNFKTIYMMSNLGMLVSTTKGQRWAIEMNEIAKKGRIMSLIVKLRYVGKYY